MSAPLNAAPGRAVVAADELVAAGHGEIVHVDLLPGARRVAGEVRRRPEGDQPAVAGDRRPRRAHGRPRDERRRVAAAVAHEGAVDAAGPGLAGHGQVGRARVEGDAAAVVGHRDVADGRVRRGAGRAVGAAGEHGRAARQRAHEGLRDPAGGLRGEVGRAREERGDRPVGRDRAERAVVQRRGGVARGRRPSERETSTTSSAAAPTSGAAARTSSAAAEETIQPLRIPASYTPTSMACEAYHREREQCKRSHESALRKPWWRSSVAGGEAMEFSVLGPFEVRVGDRACMAVPSRAPCSRNLLLHANEPVSAERLAVALWGEDAPAGSLSRPCRSYVSLPARGARRSLIGGPPLGAGYRMRVASRRARCRGDSAARGAVGLGEALAAGDPGKARRRSCARDWTCGAGRRSPISPGSGRSLPPRSRASRRSAWRRSSCASRPTSKAAITRKGRASWGGSRQAHRGVSGLHGQLMLALHRGGRQADALEAYRNAREPLLVEHLGSSPGTELAEGSSRRSSPTTRGATGLRRLARASAERA